jgi:CBS domain-containing protein
MEHFTAMKTVSLTNINDILRPIQSPPDIDLNSSAMLVFVDFELQQPFMLEQSTSVTEAAEIMRREHVRRKLVIDSEERLRGIVSMTDLISTKTMKAVNTTGLKQSELTVADVMVHKSSLQAISLEALQRASIGDALATMKEFGEEHLVVVENACVRGLVSNTDIARVLHKQVTIDERSHSVLEVFSATH